MRAAALVAVLLLAMLAGCGVTSMSTGGISYPVGPSLAEFGVRERCGPQDQSCQDQAEEVLGAVLGHLGAAVDEPAMEAPNDPPAPGRLLITFDSQPAFEWRTQDGELHGAERVVLDLTGVIDGTGSYAIIGPGDAREIDAALATAMVDALFVSTD